MERLLNKDYLLNYLTNTARHMALMPFIYIMVFPLIFFDFFLEIYHHACFPLYKLPTINRVEYIKIDRHKLKYLNVLEKLNCVYCGYANGLIHYASAIGAETEKYWCAIKHKKSKNFKEPSHHKDFIEYGDEKAFRKIKKDEML
ncbi:hypothetical protein DRH27_02155 [Candidatus Falkowbacteria bacterium]|nr:MAG: hypothetical protein DRH27_02155 [Candidatus Falkowbacteria bacterium]